MKRIHITTGDTDGIGLEVSLKALTTIGQCANTQFVLWRQQEVGRELFHALKWPGRIVTLNNIDDLNTAQKKESTLLDIASVTSPTHWVQTVAQRCTHDPSNESMVTGPLSKIQMQADQFSEKGHTPLLQRISGAKKVFMTFLGDYFNVILLTGHIPLKKIIWTANDLDSCLHLCSHLQQFLPDIYQNKPIAILGFNPHAGEEGLLGTEEKNLRLYLKKWSKKVTGPLVPDSAFLKNNWARFSIYVCLYHDQALIPFKMAHGTKSFQLSLGLPFVRTSVSHGTAKDIFGQNKASAESMRRALQWAASTQAVLV